MSKCEEKLSLLELLGFSPLLTHGAPIAGMLDRIFC